VSATHDRYYRIAFFVDSIIVYIISASKYYPTFFPTRPPSRLNPRYSPSFRPTPFPSGQRTAQPTVRPSGQPSAQPSGHPSGQPSVQPSTQPSTKPTGEPSGQPSSNPSSQPSGQPTGQPSGQPSMIPSGQPSSQPSGQPSAQPSSFPSYRPSSQPSVTPSDQPSAQPSTVPTSQPSSQPSSIPSGQPSGFPSCQPSFRPSSQPSTNPSRRPTGQPSSAPKQPSGIPTGRPSSLPSDLPSGQPSSNPTFQPSHKTTENNLKIFHQLRSIYAVTFTSHQEKAKAFSHFEQNLNKIQHLNSKALVKNSLRFGLNRFAFLNMSQFRATSLGLILPSTRKPLEGEVTVKGLPEALGNLAPRRIKTDWTGIYTTPIKNQGTCGCCYVFSAVSQIESDAIRLNHTSPLMQLSIQQPLDCGGYATVLGCKGGFPLNIFGYARRSGLVRDALYPYKNRPAASCGLGLSAPVIVSVVNIFVMQPATEYNMAVYIQNVGPLSVMVYADKWKYYTGGIMTHQSCGYKGLVNHVVQLVGIDYSNPSRAYWIVSNIRSYHLFEIFFTHFIIRCVTSGARAGAWVVSSDWSMGTTRVAFQHWRLMSPPQCTTRAHPSLRQRADLSTPSIPPSHP